MSRASAAPLPEGQTIKTEAGEMNGVEENMEEEEEEDFEEILVYLEFPDFDDNSLLHDTARVELYDITGATPTCKVGNLTFTGSSEVNLGTQLFMGADGDGSVCIGESVNVVQFKLSKIDG
mmetsp:Transcript_11004/g.24396  ORF Transcript_11004/g.24396 Transcript_11004/m.24396 type:complete len:121 (-) Transcript_11004:54-416(-)|eukprot:CAMPEP_0173264464 /NCGR_PEP_ID=MMETSP1142-20121109/27993_1 /TAXON_ID=483371 /ORGANISM="non described non described, Strain CCMP2298" /LENGTH=120 /DNA_ID=CAMNT_0014200013 /DNA_START=140 /DNA_END=502 /DNA_ORIENTATION=-